MDLKGTSFSKLAPLLHPVPSSLSEEAERPRLYCPVSSPMIDSETLRLIEIAFDGATKIFPNPAALREYNVRERHDNDFIKFLTSFEFSFSDLEKIVVLNFFKKSQDAVPASQLAEALEYYSRYKDILRPNINSIRYYKFLNYFNPLAAESFANTLKVVPHLSVETAFRNTAHDFNISKTKKLLPLDECISYFNEAPLIDNIEAFRVGGFIGLRNKKSSTSGKTKYAESILKIEEFRQFVFYSYTDSRTSALHKIRENSVNNSRCTNLISVYMAHHDAPESILEREIADAIHGKPSHVRAPALLLATKPTKLAVGRAPTIDNASTTDCATENFELTPPIKEAPGTAEPNKSFGTPPSHTEQNTTTIDLDKELPAGKISASKTTLSSIQPNATPNYGKNQQHTSSDEAHHSSKKFQSKEIKTNKIVIFLLIIILLLTTILITQYATTNKSWISQNPETALESAPAAAQSSPNSRTAVIIPEPTSEPNLGEYNSASRELAQPTQISREPTTVRLAATGDVWVQVSLPDRGQILFSATLRAGESRVLSTPRDASITIGAIQNISISIDGRDIRLESFLRQGIIRNTRVDQLLSSIRP